MRYQGINAGNIKMNNRSSILRLLFAGGPMPRKDIAEEVGLTAASVTLLTSDLIEEGVLRELGEAEEEKRAGRKKILLGINYDYRKVLSIDIESEETYIALTNLQGEILGQETMSTDRSVDAGTFLRQIAERCDIILEEHHIDKKQVLGVSVTLPGRVDRAGGRSMNTYSIWTEEVPVGKILKEALMLPVVVENNLKAYAQSEIDFGRGRTEEQLLILKWGPGVGSAIIIDHRIYTGSAGMAAEIGHMPSSEAGRRCNCGRTGCLETEVSTHAIIADIEEAYRKDPAAMPLLDARMKDGFRLTYRNVNAWATIEDEALGSLLRKKLKLMAHSVRNAVSLLDPDRVIVIGYMFDVPGVFDEFKRQYALYDAAADEDFFLRSALPESMNHTEGLAVLLEELFFGASAEERNG